MLDEKFCDRTSHSSHCSCVTSQPSPSLRCLLSFHIAFLSSPIPPPNSVEVRTNRHWTEWDCCENLLHTCQWTFLQPKDVCSWFQKEAYLCAINLHDWSPPSISTSEVFHLTVNGDLFCSKQQCVYATLKRPEAKRTVTEESFLSY